MKRSVAATSVFAVLLLFGTGRGAEKPWVTYEGDHGPGKGKHIVLVSGDEEYRSEEALPMLARILAFRHGFKCTVLFAINPDDGTIEPTRVDNIPGLENLETADMMIIFTRFRELPDEQMKHIVDFLKTGKPVLGLRTATHAFRYQKHLDSPYAKYSFRSEQWPGGFGQQVLGETWAGHYGRHGKESTRGVINPEYRDHPILRGVQDIWGPTDVYTVEHLTPDAQVLVYGQVLSGMTPDAPPNKEKPPMPLVWIKEYQVEGGKKGVAICTTMGASVDLACEDLRRLLVNACYWALGLADQIPPKADARYVGTYEPTFFGFGKFKKGLKPSDLQ